MERHHSLMKQPGILLDSGQLLIIPTFIFLLLINSLINQNNFFAHSLIFYSTVAFIIQQSNVNIFALSLLNRFLIVMLFSMLLFSIILPINYFIFGVNFEYQLQNGPPQIIITSGLFLFHQFPGTQSINETIIMFQIILLQFICTEHLTIRKPKIDIYYYSLLDQKIETLCLKFSLRFLFFSINSALFIILITKGNFTEKASNWVNRCEQMVKIVITLSIITIIFTRQFIFTYDDQLSLITLIQKINQDDFLLNNYKIIKNYFIIIIMFCLVKFILAKIPNIQGINIYYNPQHRMLWLAVERKSYHLLLFLFSYSSKNNIYLMFIVSSITIVFLAIIESMRGSINFPIIKIFHKYSEQFVSDHKHKVALNHIQLIISVCFFPALNIILNEQVSYLENSSIYTVVIADAMACLLPAIYYLMTNDIPLKWIDTLQMQFISIPVYRNWTLPFINSDSAFQHDLNMKLDNTNYNEKQKIVQLDLFQSSDLKYLVKNRTILGTFAYIVSAMISMSLIKTEAVVIILFGMMNGILEALCVQDNILLPFLQGSLVLLFKSSFK